MSTGHWGRSSPEGHQPGKGALLGHGMGLHPSSTGDVDMTSRGVSVVAVPGLGLSVAVTQPVLDRLPGLRSTVVLLPGFGRRAPRGTDLAPASLARLLLADRRTA